MTEAPLPNIEREMQNRGQMALFNYFQYNTVEQCVRFVFLDTWDSTPELNSTNNQIFHTRINHALNRTATERRTAKRKAGTNRSITGEGGTLQEVFDSLSKDVRVRD